MEGDNNMTYVTYEQSPTNNLYFITLNHDAFKSCLPNGFEEGGAGAVLLARISGLSFPDYLRMCRDIGGAELIGKNTLYPVPYFKFTEGLYAITKWLNKRAEYFVYRHDHPYEFITEDNEIKKVMDKDE